MLTQISHGVNFADEERGYITNDGSVSFNDICRSNILMIETFFIKLGQCCPNFSSLMSQNSQSVLGWQGGFSIQLFLFHTTTFIVGLPNSCETSLLIRSLCKTVGSANQRAPHIALRINVRPRALQAPANISYSCLIKKAILARQSQWICVIGR